MKNFFNPTTKFDPNYRNIQSELWVYLSDQQQAIVGGVFRHLKNHAQIELAMALINYIESDYTDMPDVLDFTDALTSGIFHYLVQQLYKAPKFQGSKAPKFQGSNPSTLNH